MDGFGKIPLVLTILLVFATTAFADPWFDTDYSSRQQVIVANGDVYDYMDYPVNVNVPSENLSEFAVACNGSAVDFGHLDAISGTDINFRVNIPAGASNNSCFIYFNSTGAVTDLASPYEPINWQFWYNFSEHSGDWQSDFIGEESWNITEAANTTYLRSFLKFIPSGMVVSAINTGNDLVLSQNVTGGKRLFVYGYGWGNGIEFGRQAYNSTPFFTDPEAAYAMNLSFVWNAGNGETEEICSRTYPYWGSYSNDGDTIIEDYIGNVYDCTNTSNSFLKNEIFWYRNSSIGWKYMSHDRRITYEDIDPLDYSYWDTGYLALFGDQVSLPDTIVQYVAFGYSDLAENMTVEAGAPEVYHAATPPSTGLSPLLKLIINAALVLTVFVFGIATVMTGASEERVQNAMMFLVLVAFVMVISEMIA